MSRNDFFMSNKFSVSKNKPKFLINSLFKKFPESSILIIEVHLPEYQLGHKSIAQSLSRLLNSHTLQRTWEGSILPLLIPSFDLAHMRNTTIRLRHEVNSYSPRQVLSPPYLVLTLIRPQTFSFVVTYPNCKSM